MTTPEAGSAASPVLDAIAAARRSKAPEDDYDLGKAHDQGTLGVAPLPEQVDLREPWHTVPQQGRTASCVGWSLADSVLRWHLVKAGRLEPGVRLSARHIWMSAKETDARVDYPSTFLEEDGTSLKQGLEVIRKFGAVLEDELPWEGRLATGSPQDFLKSAGSRRITAYFNLGDDDRERRFDGWRRWLAEHGPVAVLIKMDKHIEKAKLDGFDAGSYFGDHSAALFGYGPDHFLLRSSWGPEWGDGGYARMSLGYAEQAVIESYGVIV
jgi:papain like protease